jgi:hypothetical protein
VINEEDKVEMRNSFRTFIRREIGENHLGDINARGKSYKLWLTHLTFF